MTRACSPRGSYSRPSARWPAIHGIDSDERARPHAAVPDGDRPGARLRRCRTPGGPRGPAPLGRGSSVPMSPGHARACASRSLVPGRSADSARASARRSRFPQERGKRSVRKCSSHARRTAPDRGAAPDQVTRPPQGGACLLGLAARCGRGNANVTASRSRAVCI
jgi:hypothetical protein